MYKAERVSLLWQFVDLRLVSYYGPPISQQNIARPNFEAPGCRKSIESIKLQNRKAKETRFRTYRHGRKHWCIYKQFYLKGYKSFPEWDCDVKEEQLGDFQDKQCCERERVEGNIYGDGVAKDYSEGLAITAYSKLSCWRWWNKSSHCWQRSRRDSISWCCQRTRQYSLNQRGGNLG